MLFINNKILNIGQIISMFLFILSLYFYKEILLDEIYYLYPTFLLLFIFFHYTKSVNVRIDELKRKNKYILEKEYEHCVNFIVRESEYFKKLMASFFIFYIGLITYFIGDDKKNCINDLSYILNENELFKFIFNISISFWIYFFLLIILHIKISNNYHTVLENMIQERDK